MLGMTKDQVANRLGELLISNIHRFESLMETEGGKAADPVSAELQRLKVYTHIILPALFAQIIEDNNKLISREIQELLSNEELPAS
ncbi:MAG TPA: hypothetical protein VN611_02395 [Patescibacteria group bacterium]|nr:hypothetical protein [Patescibacteria group bacterium]